MPLGKDKFYYAYDIQSDWKVKGKKMQKVLVIGYGEIGSRHAQSLIQTDTNLALTILEKNQEVVERFHDRLPQLPNIQFVQDVAEINQEEFALLIMATPSNGRFKLLYEMVQNVSFKKIILEKFLFTDIDDYAKAQKLLQEKNIQAWVNCPRRYYPAYQKMQQKMILMNKRQTGKVSISGTAIQLGSNLIHFMDAASFLFQSKPQKIHFQDWEVIDSKRKNFKEIVGNVDIQYENGYILSVSNRHGAELILANNNGDFYNESKGQLVIDQKLYEQPLVFQSQLTGKYWKEIEESGTCGLVSYTESAQMHTLIIEALVEQGLFNDKHNIPLT